MATYKLKDWAKPQLLCFSNAEALVAHYANQGDAAKFAKACRAMAELPAAAEAKAKPVPKRLAFG